jgi:beta-glucosidase
MAAWYKVGRDETAVPINFDLWTTDTFGYRNYFASEGYGQVNVRSMRLERNLLTSSSNM